MKKKCIIYAVLAVLLTVLIVWTVWGNTTVGLTTITVTEDNLPEAFDGFRIAQVSDLHNSPLWEKTIAQLKAAEPDIIVITGDLVDMRHTNMESALCFVREAVQIAGCFYIIGNHEGRMEQDEYKQLLDALRELGVVVMENQQTMIHRDGAYIALVGHQWGSDADLTTLSDFSGYKILLHHQPESFTDFVNADYDLVLSGHVHGGQIRIPLIGGLYAPDQGLFPKFDCGMYSMENTDLIVSRGIGNSVFPIRMNNQPEVILVILEAE